MSRRRSGKSGMIASGKADGQTPTVVTPAWRGRLPAQPRQGKRWLLAASVLLFVVWLAVLTWLAFR